MGTAITIPILGEAPVFRVKPPLALYIHFPWCIRKCPYCDFNSHEIKRAIDEKAYIAALVQDLENQLPTIWGRTLSSIFIGGGTPSLLSSAALDDLLSAIRARIGIQPDAEITLEANPGTFEVEKFQGYRDAGVNRLSIGVQTFDNAALERLGRIHKQAEAWRALTTAVTIFDNVNADLMYALPQQTLKAVIHDVTLALEAGVTHVSAYHLTIEPNTYFAAHPPAHLPEDDVAADMQIAIESCLQNYGYQHYETSAFAKENRRSQHNLNYWRFGDYLGIGAGAHSKLTALNAIKRESRYKQPQAYMKAVHQGNAVQQAHTVAAKDLPFEFMMNALRLTDGVESTLFEERTGLPLTQIAPLLAYAKERQWLMENPQRLAPTVIGQRFLNDLLTLFLP